jgi:ubiquitin C-terminal hydrolase
MSGITNNHNNCFINSIIQMLTSSFEISGCFFKTKYKELFTDYESSDIIDIEDFLQYYKKSLHKDYILGIQQDAHESLCYILDDANVKTPFGINIHQILYNTNNEKSEKTTIENIISVSLKDSIQLSIDTAFETQIISDTMKIEYNAIESPDYLFVNLKRFNPVTFEKDNKEIKITDIINFNKSKYIVISYIIHSGGTRSGHYICCKKIKGNWFIFNDENIVNITEDENIKLQSLAYIFLYQKLSE